MKTDASTIPPLTQADRLEIAMNATIDDFGPVLGQDEPAMSKEAQLRIKVTMRLLIAFDEIEVEDFQHDEAA